MSGDWAETRPPSLFQDVYILLLDVTPDGKALQKKLMPGLLFFSKFEKIRFLKFETKLKEINIFVISKLSRKLIIAKLN